LLISALVLWQVGSHPVNDLVQQHADDTAAVPQICHLLQPGIVILIIRV
jgi:hypothetical protein